MVSPAALRPAGEVVQLGDLRRGEGLGDLGGPGRPAEQRPGLRPVVQPEHAFDQGV